MSYKQWSLNDVRVDGEAIDYRDGSVLDLSDSDYADGGLGLEIQFGSKRWVHHGDEVAGIEEEVVGACSVDAYGNDYLGAPDECGM